MREFSITTPGASTVTGPVMSKPSMTWFAVVIRSSPDGVSVVPAGTPVLDAPGRPAGDTGFAGTAGTGAGAGAGGGVAFAVARGLCVAGADVVGSAGAGTAVTAGPAVAVAVGVAVTVGAVPLGCVQNGSGRCPSNREGTCRSACAETMPWRSDASAVPTGSELTMK